MATSGVMISALSMCIVLCGLSREMIEETRSKFVVYKWPGISTISGRDGLVDRRF